MRVDNVVLLYILLPSASASLIFNKVAIDSRVSTRSLLESRLDIFLDLEESLSKVRKAALADVLVPS